MSNQSNSTPTRRIYSVSEFSQSLSHELADKFPSICIRGEVTDLSKPRSGHWYFSLKDEESQLRTVMFRSSNLRAHQIKEGDEIIACGKPSIYKGRGDLQLVVNHLQLSGAGDLQKKFEELKKELLENGFFDSSRKQSIPNLPTKLAVITSPSGAVIQDIQTIAARRAPSMPILVIPTAVQGIEAVRGITIAISIADQRSDIDLIVLARGGGSIEDFAAFNSREVAMAVANSKTPIISSVGHETDFSISDMVADLRAATPSEASEIASQGYVDIHNLLDSSRKQLLRLIERDIQVNEQRLSHLKNQLNNPQHRLEQAMQRLDFLEPLLESRIHLTLNKKLSALGIISKGINIESLKRQIDQKENRLKNAHQKLGESQKAIAHQKRQRFTESLQTLEAISPLSVLSRGYGISTDQSNHALVSTKELSIGEIITTKLHDGEFKSSVIEIGKKT